MDRRTFLKRAGAGLLSAAAEGAREAGGGESQDANPLAGVAIVDAHAHPDTFFSSRHTDQTSTLASIGALGMAASSFPAFGDRQARERGPWHPKNMHAVRLQLDAVHELASAGKVRLLRRAAEMAAPTRGTPPGAILALEGAHPFGEDPDKVDALHAQGVRIVTLMHYAMSDLAKKGGIVSTWPLAYTRQNAKRETFRDWAMELLEMKRRLGVTHLGIGTDGGGSLPALIHGYRDVRDLPAPAKAMSGVAFAPEEIAAVFGDNFRRVFEQAVG